MCLPVVCACMYGCSGVGTGGPGGPLAPPIIQQGGPGPPNNQAPCYSIIYNILYHADYYITLTPPLPIHLGPPNPKLVPTPLGCVHVVIHIVGRLAEVCPTNEVNMFKSLFVGRTQKDDTPIMA